jgi:UPF0716 protein FxsA
MRLVGILLLLFPFLELWLLLAVGDAIGALPTLTLLVLGSLSGVLLLRQVGWLTAWRVDQRLRAGEPPNAELMDGFALAVAGLLLLLPGFLSDLVGIAFLLRPLRRLLAGALVGRQRDRTRRAEEAWRAGRQDAGQPRNPNVIEGEYRREDE